MVATARLRIAKIGERSTGGSTPSNLSPVRGSSADKNGFARMNFRADLRGNDANDPLRVMR